LFWQLCSGSPTANFALLLGILFSDLHFPHLVLAIDSIVSIQCGNSRASNLPAFRQHQVLNGLPKLFCFIYKYLQISLTVPQLKGEMFATFCVVGTDAIEL
jgi:hypothetical protein